MGRIWSALQVTLVVTIFLMDVWLIVFPLWFDPLWRPMTGARWIPLIVYAISSAFLALALWWQFAEDEPKPKYAALGIATFVVAIPLAGAFSR